MHFARLSLLHFRNHREAELDLGQRVNCFTGPNGTGKTNLLDAVHYLSLCKSYFSSEDMAHILHGEEFFLVKGTVVGDDGEHQLACSVRQGQRKVFSRDRKEYERLADHVGRYPVVMITPYDGQLVVEGGEVRRRFLDGLIAQFDRAYLEALVRYNRALSQRNALLKQWQRHGGWQPAVLEPWDEQLIVQGEAVHAARQVFVAELAPLLAQHYAGISSGPEHVALAYRSELEGRSLRELLAERAERDRAVGHTTAGVHRDDLEFTIDDQPLKRFGSQGQQKTYLIALKLAQFDLTAVRAGMRPVLLLDDIFDKIDPGRMRHLLRLLASGRFGQVLITDTDATRLHAALDGLDLDARWFHLDHGRPITHETIQRTVAR